MDTDDGYGVSVTVKEHGKLIVHGKLLLVAKDSSHVHVPYTEYG